MYQITQYLHIPTKKMLVENIHFRHTTSQGLWDGRQCIAEKKDCRGLLTTKYEYEKYIGRINGIHEYGLEKVVYTEGDVGKKRIPTRLLNSEKYCFYKDSSSEKIGSFFDDPAHYSQLLWNCNEEEGWIRIFKLLNIKNA